MLNQYINHSDSSIKFNWTKQSIKWYVASEGTTTFYKNIMEKITPFAKDCSTVLDIGCGVGTFSLEFAKKGFEVTAIDKSFAVVEHLSKRAKHMKLDNLTSLNVSFENFKFNNNYDIIFISYMMGLIDEKNIGNILQRINKHLILIMPLNKVKNDFLVYDLYTQLGLDTNNLEQLNYLYITDFLNRKNINYDVYKINEEFGQPFNTFNEAVQFVYHYFKIPIEKRAEVVEWLNNKVIRLNNNLYLPNTRESSIILISNSGRIVC